MPKKKITLDKLAAMVQKGFEHVDLRFDRIDKKIDNVKVGLENRMDSIKSDLENRIDDVKLENDQLAPYFEVNDLKGRVSLIEKKLGIN